MYSLSAIIELYKTLGPLRFFLFFGSLTAVIVGYCAIGWWLSNKVGWPDHYGFHCEGRSCTWIELYHSHRLLRSGHLYELLLFCWMWIFPFILLSMYLFATYIVPKRWMHRRRNRIRSLRPPAIE